MGYRLIALALLAGCGGGNDVSNPPDEPDEPDEPNPPIPECTANLEWLLPTERMDETPLPLNQITRFTIYMNDESGMLEASISMTIDITDVYLIQWEFRNLPQTLGHWFYMTVSAIDPLAADPATAENLVSNYSNEVFKACSQ